MYCSHCGKKLSEDDFFCSNCGTRVEREDIWDGQDSDSFDETMLYDPKETIEAIAEKKPVEEVPFVPRSKEEERWYEQNSSARAARRLSAKRNNGGVATERPLPNTEAEHIAAEPPEGGALKPGFKGFATAVSGMFANVRNRKGTAPVADPAEAVTDFPTPEATVVEEDAEAPADNFRGLYVGVVLIGIVIGIILGLFVIKPWQTPEKAVPVPPAAVVQLAASDHMEKE